MSFPSSTNSQNHERSYKAALAELDRLASNRQITTWISANPGDMNARAIPEMLEWLERAAYKPSSFTEESSKMKVIHVAGTKGKGSVCAFITSILSQYQDDSASGLGKIGLYTSPHLVSPRERIRIDGLPISESLFAKYFWDVHERISSSFSLSSHDQYPLTTIPQSPSALPKPAPMPNYFRTLTIAAFHAFVEENVETAVVECGIGGEYDSTNIFPPEAVSVTAISRLGIDHVGMLGSTIESIAWHKAGIFKKGVEAYTVPQALVEVSPDGAKGAGPDAVLHERAAERGVKGLWTVERHPDLDEHETSVTKVPLGLDGDFQRDNASLAVAVAASHLRQLNIPEIPSHEQLIKSGNLPPKFLDGLRDAKWDGRCEIRQRGNIDWYIDGAHTVDSLEATAKWFASKLQASNPSSPAKHERTMLIFNQQDRDACALLLHLHRCLQRELDQDIIFAYAAFPTNDAYTDATKGPKTLTMQEKMRQSWHNMQPESKRAGCYQSIDAAMKDIEEIAKCPEEKYAVLVTGSLHLVGGLIKVLEGDRALT